MPRWPIGLHRQTGTQPAYGAHSRRIPTVPIEAYGGQTTRVPLNDGQGQTTVSAQGTATITIGPQGLGTVWYPAAVTVYTTSGVNDASVCNIYAGPAGIQTPTTLLGTIPSGGAGTLAAAVPPLPTGWYLTAVWTGGKQGDTASINVQGSKDARVIG